MKKGFEKQEKLKYICQEVCLSHLKWTTLDTVDIAGHFWPPCVVDAFWDSEHFYLCSLVRLLAAPRLSEQYPGIPIWIVQTEAYCSSTPLHCCRHCSYNWMRQRMCLMSGLQSRGVWIQCSVLLGCHDTSILWNFTITIIFMIGKHYYFHYDWLDYAYTVCGDNTWVPILVGMLLPIL